VSRFYDALKKAESQKTSIGGSVIGSLKDRSAPNIIWNLDDDVRREYERLQVWVTNRSARDEPTKTILVASCQQGNGATTTATRLAATLAQRPTARVLIVDANLRTPSLDLLFRARHRSGFSELLTNGAKAASNYIQPTAHANLFVLTTGWISRFPLEVFSPTGLSALVAQLKSSFDFIVFDGAPLLEFPDAHALAPHVDAVLVVVEADRTLVEDARSVVRELARSGVKVAGIVLNRQPDYTPQLFRRVLRHANWFRVAHP
jgi:capsular exopolysaccharide synthesis family protein